MLPGAKSITMSGPKQPFYHAKGPQMEAKNGHFSNRKRDDFYTKHAQQADYQRHNKVPLFSFQIDKGWS